jgi:hypothetical protein
MAIISIPSSIGGVTIPGSLINGPLSALFGNQYGLSSLQYPRDLGSATKGHVVQFAIREIQPVTFSLGGALSGISSLVETAFNSATNFTGSSTQGQSSSISQFLTPETTKIVSTIALYMPDTVNFQLNATYNGGTNLLDAAASLPVVGKLGEEVGKAAKNSAMQLALKKAGYAVNPQLQLLFESIDFREYQMSFTFTPYSAQEAQTVKEIIKMFRKHSMPQIVTQAAGMFFIPPSVFDITFLYNGQENKNINKIARSVIQSVDVNYAPDGWSAHDDGAPTQTTLTLNFKETFLIDKTKIDQGY